MKRNSGSKMNDTDILALFTYLNQILKNFGCKKYINIRSVKIPTTVCVSTMMKHHFIEYQI